MIINRGHLAFALLLLSTQLMAQDNAGNTADRIMAEAKAGNLITKITDVAEFKIMIGAPLSEETRPDGDGTITTLVYDGGITARFKQQNRTAPLVLKHIEGIKLDLGKPAPRTITDLRKLDIFWGLQNVSLVKLDLRDQKEFLTTMSFDSHTDWPQKDMLPAGFNPAQLMENGKNPGLGIRQLHAQGIDGRTVSIAIIDQPLLQNHREYSGRIVYSSSGVDGVPPQMHGPSVASLAVGKDVGTAPKASLYYFAIPSWSGDNSYYTDALNTIIAINSTKPAAGKIHAVSISTGMFNQQKNYDQWLATLRKAREAGILVITCDEADPGIDFGTLTRDTAKNADLTESYLSGKWDKEKHSLWVPEGNRTHAGYTGEGDYVFDVAGGRSWAPPYLAGVAALGYQLNPELTPAQVAGLLVKSATQTQYGPIINPGAFIELVRGTVKR